MERASINRIIIEWTNIKINPGFTREEEIDFGTIDDVPFLLEESLARNAARYNKVQPWGEFVVEDNRVITGQNPTSAHAVGAALVKLLAK